MNFVCDLSLERDTHGLLRIPLVRSHCDCWASDGAGGAGYGLSLRFLGGGRWVSSRELTQSGRYEWGCLLLCMDFVTSLTL